MKGNLAMKRKIGLIGDNSVKYIDTLLNILLDGHVAVLIDWRIPLNVSLSVLQQAGIEECYIESTKFAFTEKTSKLKITLFDTDHKGAEEVPSSIYEKYATLLKKQSADDSLIFFSSGTTGKSKGIRLSLAAINHNVDAIIDYMHPSKSDTILISKALTHSSTITGELFVGLKSNTRIIVEPTVTSPTSVLKDIKKFDVSIWCM